MNAVVPYIPRLISGLGITLQIAVGSFLVGFVIAVLAVFGWRVGSAPLRAAISTYVAVVRALPELLIIFLVYYGGTILLTGVAGRYVEVDARTAGIAALSVVAGAYMTEVLRGALSTIPPGQWEAAHSLGLKEGRTYRHVILPQMFLNALPGLGNQWLIILKESALVSIIGLEDLMRTSIVGAGATHAPLPFYLATAGIYVAVTALSSVAIGYGSSCITPGHRS